MRKLHLPAWLKNLNLWIALGLLLANLLAWASAAPAAALPQVEPRLDPQIVKIREDLWSGTHRGEPFSIVITEQMAAEAIAWFLARHPEVPFSHPQVEIDPAGITGRGLVHLLGLRTPVYGRASLSLEDGKPVVRLIELGVAGAALPPAIFSSLQAQVSGILNQAQNLPVELSRLEMGEGTITVEGVYK
jgi:hypothetical protein